MKNSFHIPETRLTREACVTWGRAGNGGFGLLFYVVGRGLMLLNTRRFNGRRYSFISETT